MISNICLEEQILIKHCAINHLILLKSSSGGSIKKYIIQNEELAEELPKPITRKFKNWKVYLSFMHNICVADLANTQLIHKFSKDIRFSLRVINFSLIDTFSKYTWVIPLKNKKGITITNTFQQILHKFNYKPNKIWVDKGSKFYNRSIKSWLQGNKIEIYSIHNKRKSVVAERFIGTLKNKIDKYMTSISKNVYINKLDNIFNKYNNTYHRTIKIKPVNVKSSTHILTLIKKIIRKVLNLKLVIMLEYLNIKIFLQKVMFQISLKKFLLFKKLKTLCRVHMILVILREKKFLKGYTKKNLKRTNQKELKK